MALASYSFKGIIRLTAVGKALWGFSHLDPEKTLSLLTFHGPELVTCPAQAAGSLGTVQEHVDVSDRFADEKIETQRRRREGTKLVTYRSVAELGWESSLPSHCAHGPRGG